jgi:hypothetical protein
MLCMAIAAHRVANRRIGTALASGLVATLAVLGYHGVSAEAATTGRDPVSIMAQIESALPTAWRDEMGPAAWQVGGNQYADSAGEVRCSGAAGTNGPLMTLSPNVYSSKTDVYWLQVIAHEYGHLVVCYLFATDSTRFDEWTAAAGPVTGAPNHYEMFAQCWARYVTGSAPAGYTYRCPDGAAWDATLRLVSEGPVEAPLNETQPAAPAYTAAPDVAAMTATVARPASRSSAQYTPGAP